MTRYKVSVDRRHIAYQPPFHVESFPTRAAIGCDASGMNCVRIHDGQPGKVMWWNEDAMKKAVEALNAEPVSDLIEAEIEGEWEFL